MRNVDEAIVVLLDVLDVAINLTIQLEAVSDSIKRARAEGRDVSDEELDALKSARLAARKAALEA